MNVDDWPRAWRAAADTDMQAALSRALRASRFLQRTLLRQSNWTLETLSGDGFRQAPGRPVAERLPADLRGIDGIEAFQAALRRFRQREMATIAVRDIGGWAVVDETLGALTALAEAACDAALSFAARTLQQRHGVPRDPQGGEARPIVLGMGKLGGGELNFSSDIDLIFAYTDDGQTDGERPLENAEYFGRLARETARLLSVITEDGFVFRVDTMLRPFGSVGAAALSMDAMEHYYQAHGREWERYALVKARPVAGDRGAGEVLLETLRPFVYRRYLDFTALGALRALKQAIDADARRRGVEDDLKLGPGGIRELEFIVQLFQLTRGGHDVRLRDSSLRRVLAQLGNLDLLPVEQTRALDTAYLFLRRCENALQIYDDAQTHRLPEDDAGWSALCAALNIADRAAVLDGLRQVRGLVSSQFESLFAQPDRDQTATAAEPHRTLWTAGPESMIDALRRYGYRHAPEPLAERLMALRQSRLVRTLNEPTFAVLRVAVSLLVEDAAKLESPEVALSRALDVVVAIGGRTTYFSLLRDSEAARAQLLRLVAASPRIAALIAQTPALLDALMDPDLASEAPQREALFAELAQRAGGVDATDTEASMALLRGYRQEMMLRIAAADLADTLPLVEVSDRLTWLAEAIVGKAVSDAHLQLSAQYGQALDGDGRPAPFTIIGYGKFGSIELGYASDLDLVFVYRIDDAQRETAGGRRSLTAAEYFVRLGQRIVQFLSAMTSAGRAYEIDLQLRPSGASGLVVSSLESWARYQREAAWTWEHQALLRARPVAGDHQLGAAVDAIRCEVLTRPRDAARLRSEVVTMRHKMRAQMEKRVDGRWDVKQGAGGLIDSEFLVQYLLLRDAAAHPELVKFTDNWRQIDALTAAGVFEKADAEALVAAGRAYRNWMHRRAMQDADGLADAAQFKQERAHVKRLWQQFMEIDAK